MRVLTLKAPGELAITKGEMPDCGPGDVMVRLAYVGFCGTDLSSYQGRNPLVSYPVVPGHEIAGTVEQKGSCVPDSIQPGQAVTVLPYFNCGTCVACRTNRPNACRNNRTMGVQRQGGFSDFICVPHQKVIPVQDLELREIALVEPLAVGFHAVQRTEVERGAWLAVLGTGMIGIGVLLGAAERGAKVIAVDISDEKLTTARELGAAYTINASREDLGARLNEITDGDGPAVVVEAAGSAATFRQAVEVVSACGRVVYIGYTKTPVEYETRVFVMKEIEIKGSRGATLDDFARVIDFLSRRRDVAQRIISRTAPFEQAAKAMEDWAANPAAFTKILIEMGAIP